MPSIPSISSRFPWSMTIMMPSDQTSDILSSSTLAPSLLPSQNHPIMPTTTPRNYPSVIPRLLPTFIPTVPPRQDSTMIPIKIPSFYPINTILTYQATMMPPGPPSYMPSNSPSNTPTAVPSKNPMMIPKFDTDIISHVDSKFVTNYWTIIFAKLIATMLPIDTNNWSDQWISYDRANIPAIRFTKNNVHFFTNCRAVIFIKNDTYHFPLKYTKSISLNNTNRFTKQYQHSYLLHHQHPHLSSMLSSTNVDTINYTINIATTMNASDSRHIEHSHDNNQTKPPLSYGFSYWRQWSPTTTPPTAETDVVIVLATTRMTAISYVATRTSRIRAIFSIVK